MKTSINSNINFNAKFIRNTLVKRTSFFKPQSCEQVVSFVEFDKKSVADFNTFIKLRKNWKPSYLDDIGYNLTTLWGKMASIYFLTTQINKFKKLDANNIIGVIAVCPDSEGICIDFLQIDPKHLNNKQQKRCIFDTIFQPTYSHCGTAILNCIKKEYPQKKLTTLPAINTISFYKKNGFTKKENKHKYEYTPKS